MDSVSAWWVKPKVKPSNAQMVRDRDTPSRFERFRRPHKQLMSRTAGARCFADGRHRLTVFDN